MSSQLHNQTEQKSETACFQKIAGCLTGVQIGDAMGMPVEGMGPKAILKATNGQGITGFRDAIQKKIRDTAHLKAGDTTDDWLATTGVARSLLHDDTFNLEVCIRDHLIDFRREPNMWGYATKRALSAFEKYLQSNGKEGRHWEVSAPVQKMSGCGNGVAMKIAPLALLHAIKHPKNYPQTMLTDVMNLGLATHWDPRASFAAYALGGLIASIYHEPLTMPLADRAHWGITRRLYEKEWRYRLNQVIKEVQKAEKDWKGFRENPNTVSRELEIIRDHNLPIYKNIQHIRRILGTGPYALESVPFSITMFLRNPTDFRSCLLDTINAGGDTDTNGAMVGALLGVNRELKNIPEEWINWPRAYKQSDGKIVHYPAFLGGESFAYTLCASWNHPK